MSPADPIRIGVLTSLSGDDQEIGKVTVDAAQFATDQVNANGGLKVAGQQYPIELAIGDTTSTSEGAISAAQVLINQEDVVAIVGPQYSRYAIPVSRLAQQAAIPMISPRSTNPETTAGKSYVFRAIFTDTFQGKAIAHFAREELQAETAAVLYDIASPYNRGIAQVFQQVFTDLEGQVVAFEDYTTGTTDFTEPLQRIKASSPNVLFLPNYESEVPRQAQQARRLGIQATLLGSDAWGSMQDEDWKGLDGAYYSDHYSLDTQNPTTQAFVDQFTEAYGYVPPAGAAATYDSFGILFKAIQAKQSYQPEAIRDGIANLGIYQGVTGRIEYRGSGDPIVSVAIQKVEGGQPVFYQEVTP
ncbi:ethanolamine utilization protein EutJ [filamentous cyanobacterium CCP5]|nr:ethanolamine utilization protein EutJ [filamentous cyanobacterium CCP5]